MKKRLLFVTSIILIISVSVTFYIITQRKDKQGGALQLSLHLTQIEKEDVIAKTNEILPTSASTIEEVKLPISTIVQETNYYCVPACVQMVLRYFGIEKSQSSLADEMLTSPTTGTEYVDLAKAINHYLFNKGLAPDNESGYHIQTMGVNDSSLQLKETFEKRIKEDIDTNYPVFLAVNTKSLYPQLSDSNHMILIVGYSIDKANNDIVSYHIVDPYTKVQDPILGGQKTFTGEELFHAMVSNIEPAYLW